MISRTIRNMVVVAGLISAAAGSAMGYYPAVGPRAGEHPDVIVSGVGSSINDLWYYGTKNGISAYAMGSVSCNIATNLAWSAIWIDGSGELGNQHPVIGSQMYRYHNNRFEQVGMSWLKHGFCAWDVPNCAALGTGVPIGEQASCDWLGTGQTDTYLVALNGHQLSLGPRSEVNAWNGQFPYPYVLGNNEGFDCLGKRLQVAKADLDPALFPGAVYWGETVYVTTDEWEPQRLNNYSHRRLGKQTFAQTTPTGDVNTCSSEVGYNMWFVGDTIYKKPAIEAWKAADAGVKLVYALAPHDGQFVVGSKAVDLGNGTWRYEYAVMNMNSDRSAGSFSIPKAAVGIAVSDLGFHAPFYHSGETYDPAPWASTKDGTSVTWSTQSFGVNPNANAIRWSTLYNFRFVADQPPTTGVAEIGLFKPGVPGDPDRLLIDGLDVPSTPTVVPCIADFNTQSGVTVQDIFDFLSAWFELDPRADVNHAEGVNVQDIFDFLNAWFAGCP